MSQLRGNLAEATKTSEGVAYKPAAQPDLVARVLSPEKLRQACIKTSYVHKPTPDPSKCKIEEDNIMYNMLGDTYTFTVNVKNEHDIPCRGNVTIELRTLRDGSVIRPTVTALSPSRYKVSYTPATRGRHELSVTVNGEHINGSPFRVFVQIILRVDIDHPIAKITNLVGPTAVHCNGERIVVTDHGDGQVILYNQHLQQVAIIRGETFFRGKQLKGCADSIIDGESNIYITTFGDNRLHKYNKDGIHIKSVSGTRKKGDQFKFPNGMCISKNSYLCVCDTHNYRILVFDTCLNYLRALNIRGQPINVEEFAGKLYVSIEIPHGCIEVLTMNGMPLHTIRHQALRIPVTARVRNNLLYVAGLWK